MGRVGGVEDGEDKKVAYGERSFLQEAKNRNYQRNQLFGITETIGGVGQNMNLKSTSIES